MDSSYNLTYEGGIIMALTVVESRVQNLEGRVGDLEVASACTTINIDNLIKRLDSISGWLKALVITLVPCTLSAVGFLIWNVFKH